MPDQIPIASPSREPGRRRTPLSLWDAVRRARVDVADERARPSGHGQPTAQAELVLALEAYVLSLAERGHPVPYALRDELRLQRLTCRSRYAAEADVAEDRHRSRW